MTLNEALNRVGGQPSIKKMLEVAEVIYMQNKGMCHIKTKEHEGTQIDYAFGSVVLPILRGGGEEYDKRDAGTAYFIRQAMASVREAS